MARINKQEPMVKKTCDSRKTHIPIDQLINQLKIDTPHRMKTTNLFACAGINQYYLSNIGVDVVLTNELESDRAKLNHAIFKNSTMVIGDITNPKVQDKLAEIANKEKPQILLASPCCQQITRANTRKDEDSNEQYLFEAVMEHLKRCPSYEFCTIENAEDMLTFKTKKYELPLGDQIEKELRNLGFQYVCKAVQNAKHFGVAINRPRTIIMASKVKPIKLPEAITPIPLTLEDVIDDLPTLESGMHGPDWYDEPEYVAPWQAAQIRITPTGERVVSPLTLSKKLSGAKHAGAFSRARWDEPMHSIMTNSGELSAYHMIHPGRKIVDTNGNPVLDRAGNEQFTDSRTFTIHEIFRAIGLPDDINIPYWARQKTKLLRTVLGECWVSAHCAAVVAEFVKAEFDIKS